MTQNAVMCYATTLENFHNNCQNQTAADQGLFNWIIMNPFKSESSNEIIDDIKNDRDKNVTGLIFETNQIITTNQTYEWPQIMSEATYDTCAKFQAYAYNLNPGYNATYTHTFIQNCWVLEPVVPTYFAYGGAWGAITILFIVAFYCVPETERFSLQKSLIFLPLLKCAEVFLEGGFLN